MRGPGGPWFLGYVLPAGSKHAAIAGYLCEQMTVSGMVEALEQLYFNKRDEARLVLDRGVRDYLVRAIRKPR
jgi:hypothetical protein